MQGSFKPEVFGSNPNAPTMKWKNTDPRKKVKPRTRIIIGKATIDEGGGIYEVSLGLVSLQPDGSTCVFHSMNDKMACLSKNKEWNDNWYWVKAPDHFQSLNYQNIMG